MEEHDDGSWWGKKIMMKKEDEEVRGWLSKKRNEGDKKERGREQKIIKEESWRWRKKVNQKKNEETRERKRWRKEENGDLILRKKEIESQFKNPKRVQETVAVTSTFV